MRTIVLGLLALSLTGCGVAGNSSAGKAEVEQAFVAAVPRSLCGPGSRPEADLQGRTKGNQDLTSGRAAEGYQCNLEEIGHEGDGSEWQMAWYEDCAYYGLGVFFANGSTTVVAGTKVPGGGVAVVDATDPTNPIRTATLQTPAMIDPWESLKVNDKRGLLAGSALSIEGPAVFDVYDLTKADPAAGTPAAGQVGGCAHPTLASSVPVDPIGHEGEWAPDGRTYYGSGFLVPFTTAIDVTQPNAPHQVATIQEGIHGMSISDNGNRIYAAKMGSIVGNQGNGANTGANGLEIWDVSQINAREPAAAGTQLNPIILGSLYWDDGSVAQMTIPVTIKGKKYVIFIDEGGGACCGITAQTPGMARIIDINDETRPFLVSNLRDEIDLTENWQLRADDAGGSGFTYQGHYCGVPQRDEPGVVACSYFWQGVRVFDIRDPYHPKEIAYWVPPNPYASSKIRFVPERGELWLTNQKSGFHILKFTNGAWPFTS